MYSTLTYLLPVSVPMLVHLCVGQSRYLSPGLNSPRLSAAAGTAIAYVFVYIMSGLSGIQSEIGAIAMFAGWLVGALTQVHPVTVGLWAAFVGGGLVTIAIREELPGDRNTRFVPLLLGLQRPPRCSFCWREYQNYKFSITCLSPVTRNPDS